MMKTNSCRGPKGSSVLSLNHFKKDVHRLGTILVEDVPEFRVHQYSMCFVNSVKLGKLIVKTEEENEQKL